MAIHRLSRRVHGSRQWKDYLLNSWHQRRIVSVGGSLSIALPKKLVDWDKEQRHENERWEPGDIVEIGATYDRRGQLVFVVRYSEENKHKGLLAGDEMDDVMGRIEQLASPKKKRRKVIHTTDRHGLPKKRVVYESEDEGE